MKIVGRQGVYELKANNGQEHIELLSRLTAGSTLIAKVIGQKGRDIVLMLSDGSLIKGSSLIPLQKNKGEWVSFTVREKQGGRLYLETTAISRDTSAMPQETATAPQEGIKGDGTYLTQLKQILTDLGMVPDNENIQILKLLFAGKSGITGDLISQVQKILKEIPGSNLRETVFLIANGIAASEQNLSSAGRLEMSINQSILLIQGYMDMLKSALSQMDTKTLEALLSGSGSADSPMGQPDVFSEDAVDMPADKYIGMTQTQTEGSDGTYENVGIGKTVEKLVDKILGALPVKELSGENLRQFISKFYDGIDGRLENMKSILENLSISREIPHSKEAMNILKDMSGDIAFLREVGSCLSYFQIPVDIVGERADCQLYVFRNPRKRHKGVKEPWTLFVSLHTEQIGLVESLITFSDRNLRLRFSVEKESTLRKIRSKSTELYGIFHEMGIKLTECTCLQMESKSNVVMGSGLLNPFLSWDGGNGLDIRV